MLSRRAPLCALFHIAGLVARKHHASGAVAVRPRPLALSCLDLRKVPAKHGGHNSALDYAVLCHRRLWSGLRGGRTFGSSPGAPLALAAGFCGRACGRRGRHVRVQRGQLGGQGPLQQLVHHALGVPPARVQARCNEPRAIPRQHLPDLQHALRVYPGNTASGFEAILLTP